MRSVWILFLLGVSTGCETSPASDLGDGGTTSNDDATTMLADAGSPMPTSSAAIPADRVVPWVGNVGVEGGIPARLTTRNCVTSDNVPTNGTSDATQAIKACIANTPEGQAAFLPAGSYKITDTITIPSNKTLRGAGSKTNPTILFTSEQLDNLLYIGTGASDSTLLAANSGYTKGSSLITLANASTILAGDYVLINEKNDASIPVTKESYAEAGGCGWCDQFGATRLRAQVTKVTAKSGNTITISPAMYYDFHAANDPRVMKLDTPTELAGIEDLVVKNNAGIGNSWNVNVMIAGAANSWVKNVKHDTCGKRCVDLRTYYFRIEVRDSWFEECLNHDDSDTCYATELAEGSASLIENNVYYRVSQAPMLMWGASGNVIAYNYAEEVFRYNDRDNWFWPNSWTHGAHPSYNLWEGNEMTGINWDGYWGSASHNMAFRNRFTSFEAAAGLVAGHVEVAAVIAETNNHYMSVVGNVLGKDGWSNKYEEVATRNWAANLIYGLGTGGSGDMAVKSTMFRHQNFDYATKSVKRCGDEGEPACQGGDGTDGLPASLYLTQKPAWFADAAFPPIDPGAAGGPKVADIPAKRRFAGN